MKKKGEGRVGGRVVGRLWVKGRKIGVMVGRIGEGVMGGGKEMGERIRDRVWMIGGIGGVGMNWVSRGVEVWKEVVGERGKKSGLYKG